MSKLEIWKYKANILKHYIFTLFTYFSNKFIPSDEIPEDKEDDNSN